jgi:hypothetical protein
MSVAGDAPQRSDRCPAWTVSTDPSIVRLVDCHDLSNEVGIIGSQPPSAGPVHLGQSARGVSANLSGSGRDRFAPRAEVELPVGFTVDQSRDAFEMSFARRCAERRRGRVSRHGFAE